MIMMTLRGYSEIYRGMRHIIRKYLKKRKIGIPQRIRRSETCSVMIQKKLDHVMGEETIAIIQ